MKLPISAIILTYNEELNIGNCLESIADWVGEILIVDGGPNGAYSDDKTLNIAKKYGAKIFKNPFKNQAQQYNWALDNLDVKNEWILRLDSDEKITGDLWQEIADVLPKTENDVNGFYIKRRLYFMGRWMKYGGYYPTWILRLFRYGKARIEAREVDEHTVLSEGRAGKLKNDFIHDDQKNLGWWIDRHNKYSLREANEIIKSRPELKLGANLKGAQAEQKRWFKEKFYLRLPLFFRPFFYFIYRYFFLLGFLDGKEGLIFHFLQCFWYRFLVDAKLYEIKKKSEK